MTHVYVQVSGV